MAIEARQGWLRQGQGGAWPDSDGGTASLGRTNFNFFKIVNLDCLYNLFEVTIIYLNKLIILMDSMDRLQPLSIFRGHTSCIQRQA